MKPVAKTHSFSKHITVKHIPGVLKCIAIFNFYGLLDFRRCEKNVRLLIVCNIILHFKPPSRCILCIVAFANIK